MRGKARGQYRDDDGFEVVVYGKLPSGVSEWLKRKFQAAIIEDSGMIKLVKEYLEEKDQEQRKELQDYLSWYE